MTDATASTPATKSSLDTMLDTIEAGTEVLQRVMPEAEALGGIVPGASVYIQFGAMALPVVQNAIKWIEQEEGKSPLQAFEDVIRTLAPGNGFVAPALAKTTSA